MTSKDPRQFDVRVVERNLRKGIISEKDLSEFVRSLPDVADNAEETEVAQPGVVDDSSEQDVASDGETNE